MLFHFDDDREQWFFIGSTWMKVFGRMRTVFYDCCKHNLSLCEAILKYCHCGFFSIFCYKLCEIVEALIGAWLTQSLKHFECEPPIKVLKLSPISPKMNHSLQVEFQSCDTLLLHPPNAIVISHILPCLFITLPCGIYAT